MVDEVGVGGRGSGRYAWWVPFREPGARSRGKGDLASLVCGHRGDTG